MQLPTPFLRHPAASGVKSVTRDEAMLSSSIWKAFDIPKMISRAIKRLMNVGARNGPESPQAQHRKVSWATSSSWIVGDGLQHLLKIATAHCQLSESSEWFLSKLSKPYE